MPGLAVTTRSDKTVALDFTAMHQGTFVVLQPEHWRALLRWMAEHAR
jgi:hypothetical protein